MMVDWKELTVGDLCDTISDTYHRNNDEVVLVNTSDVLEGRILNHQAVENKNLKGQFKKTFKKDDILYSEIRPANKRYAYVDFEETDRYIASTKLMVLRPKTELVNPRFLFAFLSSNHVLAELQHLAETRSGTFPQITFSSELAPMAIAVPDFETQEKIVGMLSSIEEKTQNNNAINENLLQQVTTYFHHCFDRYEESRESVRQLGDVARFKYGTMPKKDKLGSGEYVAFSGYQVVGAYPEKMYSAPQLIIVARGVGGCGDIKYTPSNCFLTNLSIAIQTEQIAIEDYLYHYLRLHNTKMMNTGSAQPQITVSTLEKYQLPIPAQELLESFSVFAQPFKNLYRKNREENERLASIRDMLLPQLMSGELDVSEIDL